MHHPQLLNFQFHQAKQVTKQPTLVFIHGLFGDMNNLGIIARAFSDDYDILRVDLRNHGQSFHAEYMNYALMAEDLFMLIQHLNLKKVILIGHSMGGKTAMKLTALHPEIVEKLIVIDIAPLPYGKQGHQDVFQGLFAVKQAKPETRQQAKQILEQEINESSVVQFMLKSFEPSSPEFFRFNLTALFNNYSHLMDWQNVNVTVPSLFIKGGNSAYIKPEDAEYILQQFPNATSFTINGCGHWVHAEKPDFVVRAINRFLNKN
ncbi:alpha/beta fold hydrolase [Rodentibacter genomosp. 2]|uniref:Alpha/beta hydrolase n=1 Tax=Rodentibacter genomosp. 2 TaxID=1908266 RepID=A0A1V3JEA8_9PAST|nr:alpha/beta fold hydrolase [Rodentibacter genomosp. 2]OOF55101.1 alpha/beta hydrolase [Rodentibacter genomosp. 2]OOF57904.1 alpha/beta hydrolase [Rodentibacter genomosp. 2]